MLTDTHCHLNFAAFDLDREAIITSAREMHVNRILNPGIDLPSSEEAIRLAGTFTEVYAAVGVHPNEALKWDGNTMTHLRTLARQPKVAAIGEIGLDYYRDHAPPELQRSIFIEQLQLASELELPVVVHTRDSKDGFATHDTFDILTDWLKRTCNQSSKLQGRAGVLHSFSSDLEMARNFMSIGFFIGITGPVTFKNAATLQNVVSKMPLEVLLVETDAPFLTPHPYRGQRNQPAYVGFTVKKLAELKDISYDLAAQVTTANARRIFSW